MSSRNPFRLFESLRLLKHTHASFKVRQLLRGGDYSVSAVSKRGKDVSRRGISVVGGT